MEYASTNYEFIKDMWNMNYDNKVDENLTIPNYTKLTSKSEGGN